jgi:hypothetical protein
VSRRPSTLSWPLLSVTFEYHSSLNILEILVTSCSDKVLFPYFPDRVHILAVFHLACKDGNVVSKSLRHIHCHNLVKRTQLSKASILTRDDIRF